MKICIVTVSFNDSENLQQTIQSVIRNKKPYHLYYVIDGGSTDDSLDVIKKNCNIIDDYISEKDKGIYDGMNKIDRFNIEDDDFILWLNAGDELLDWSHIDIFELQHYKCAFFSVISKFNKTDNGILLSPKIFTPYNEKNFYPKSIYLHQGFLVKYELFKKNKYDLSVGLQAENLLMSKCVIENSFIIKPLPISVYYLNGISNTRYFDVLISYINVTRVLNFSFLKIIYYKRIHLIKFIIKILIPLKLVRIVQYLKRCL